MKGNRCRRIHDLVKDVGKIERDVARIDERMSGLATREDLAGLKVELLDRISPIEKSLSAMLWKVLLGMAVVSGAVEGAPHLWKFITAAMKQAS